MENKLILGAIIFLIMIIIGAVGVSAELSKRRAFEKRK
jgi:Ca2+/Na+ antiporter